MTLRPLVLIGPLFSWNHGQTCCAGTRVFVQSGVYDKFLAKFTEKTQTINVGDPFGKDTHQGPQVSQVQFDVRSPSFLFRNE
jgi:acyl-CoA reductase-like NAD-dependent aldehyde dehydrogenase